MPTNRSFNLNLIGNTGNKIGSGLKSSAPSSSINSGKGVYLPKSLFTPSSYYSYQSPYSKQSGGGVGGFDYRRLPPNVDWGLLFNLAVFTIFVCSFFYICLYRYRNKQKIRKENELKQKKLVYEFNKALKEKHRQETVKKYNQILENKRMNQMTIGGGLNNFVADFDNPYLIKNDDINANFNNQNLNSQFQTLPQTLPQPQDQSNDSLPFGEIGAFNQFDGGFSNFDFNNSSLGQNQYQSESKFQIKNTTKNEKNSYDLARQSYKIDSYRNTPSMETPFNNQVNLMNY